MLLAALDDTPYKILVILHILSAMAAFSAMFTQPFLVEQSKQLDSAERQKLFGFMVQNGRRVYAPALLVTGLLGFGLAGMSGTPPTGDPFYSMSDTWLVIACVCWIAMNGVLHGVITPAEKAMAAGDQSAEGRISAGGGAISILLVVMLWLMIFKPFL